MARKHGGRSDVDFRHMAAKDHLHSSRDHWPTWPRTRTLFDIESIMAEDPRKLHRDQRSIRFTPESRRQVGASEVIRAKQTLALCVCLPAGLAPFSVIAALFVLLVGVVVMWWR